MTAPLLQLTRVLPADPQRVFDAWTQPETMAKWFVVDPTWTADVTADLREGGAYSLKMNSPDGPAMATNGEYKEIDPPHRLVFTWSNYMVEHSVVTIELRAVDGGTELKLVHEFLETEEQRTNHEGGWIGCLASLEAFLSA